MFFLNVFAAACQHMLDVEAVTVTNLDISKGVFVLGREGVAELDFKIITKTKYRPLMWPVFCRWFLTY